MHRYNDYLCIRDQIMHPENIENLIKYFAKLPGIGPKTAERFVFYLLKQPKDFSYSFASTINNLANSITSCSNCHAISQTNPCMLCVDNTRSKTSICVVNETHDMTTIESTGLFKGQFHVLNGVLDPIHGVTPDKLTIDSLLRKVQNDNNITEIILALNPDIEGESTMLYLKKLLSTFTKIKITRLALGLPTGSDLEYADQNTLSKAISNRTNV